MTPLLPENPSETFDLKSLGSWLKSARENRNETLDDVARVTRIGKNYLEALEEGSAAKLPSQAYTKGFIRLYASHLGLSPEEALSRMGTAQSATLLENLSTEEAGLTTKSASSLKKMMIPIAAALILTSAIGYLLLKPGGSKKSPESVSSSTTAKPEASAKIADVPQTKSVPQDTQSLPSANTLKPAESPGIILRLKAVSDGRIHITIDGSISQDYELITGDLVEWKAENSFVLDLENAASVEGELDGAKLGPFGDPGKSVHLLLKADGLHKD